MQRLEKAAAEASKQSAAAKTATGDTVQLSADAALANDAVKAANESPDIRTDLVERMRALLAAGELGSDAGVAGRQPDRQHARQDGRHGQEMTTDEKAIFKRLERALQAVGDALSRADLESVALRGAGACRRARGRGARAGCEARRGLRAAIDGGRAALLRCRRLGAALVEFTRISLDPCGEAGYSRMGMLPGADRAAMPGAVGPTMEARG